MLKKIPVLSAFMLCCLACSKTATVPVTSTQNLLNKQNIIQKARAGSPIKIACEGTSLTYGEDIGGTDTVHGYNGGPTRAIDQYPAEMMLGLHLAGATLSMRGYPGDRTTEGLTRWADSTSADVCIVEYGTNDAYNFAAYPSGPVSVSMYTTQLKEIVQRRIDQGAWVILCLPPYLQNHDNVIAAYRIAAATVAHELSLDVFDVESSIAVLQSPYSDLVHFNSRGYLKWGVDLLSILNPVK